jgi:hypothetical protein
MKYENIDRRGMWVLNLNERKVTITKSPKEIAFIRLKNLNDLDKAVKYCKV